MEMVNREDPEISEWMPEEGGSLAISLEEMHRQLLSGSDKWMPPPPDTLEPTWWLFDEPGMDDQYEIAKRSIDILTDRLEVQPFYTESNEAMVFIARFEFPKYMEAFQYPAAEFLSEGACGWIHFLGGFPIDCCEMIGFVGELSPVADLSVQSGSGFVAAPVPESFFEGMDADKLLMNLTALPEAIAEILADSVDGEQEPDNLHWWLAVNLPETTFEEKYPTPGEFLAMLVRMMPDKPWGSQKSSPFLWSGNFMDTVYYTSGVIKEILEPTDLIPFPRYRMQWRAPAGITPEEFEAEDDLVVLRPSDFASYEVDDRGAILKDVETEKTTQLWKDADMTEVETMWQIVPITFYEMEAAEGEAL